MPPSKPHVTCAIKASLARTVASPRARGTRKCDARAVGHERGVARAQGVDDAREVARAVAIVEIALDASRAAVQGAHENVDARHDDARVGF